MCTKCRLVLVAMLASVSLSGCRRGGFGDNGNLGFIGLGLANYAAANGTFPDNIYDKKGTPLLSWRVVLLKYSGDRQHELFRKFHLDEPWNSPHNLQVAQEIPQWYQDPQGSKFTPYLAVTGDKAAFRPRNPRPWKPGPPRTAIIVSVRNSDVLWSEPRDISLEDAQKEDHLRWEGSRTFFFGKVGTPEYWDKNDVDMCPKPRFDYEAKPPEESVNSPNGIQKPKLKILSDAQAK